MTLQLTPTWPPHASWAAGRSAVPGSPWSDGGLQLTVDRCEPGPGTCGFGRRRRTQDVAGSGDKQAKAKPCFEDRTRSRLRSAHRPDARSSRRLRTHLPLGVRPDSGPHRNAATDMIVQVCLRAGAVGFEEAVCAVPRDGAHSIRARRSRGSAKDGLRPGQRPRRAGSHDVSQNRRRHIRLSLLSLCKQPLPRRATRRISRTGELGPASDGRWRKPSSASKDWSSNASLSRWQPRTALRLRDAAARMQGRRFHRGDVTAGGLQEPPASTFSTVRASPGSSPDLCGDPRLGAPRHGVGSDGACYNRNAGHDTAFLAVTTPSPHHACGPGNVSLRAGACGLRTISSRWPT